MEKLLNILAQLLPGVREFRTPFAAGALWVLTAFLAAYLLPAAAFANVSGLVMQVIRFTDRFPDSLVLGACSLAVYLIGVAAGVLSENGARLFQMFMVPLVRVGAVIAIISGLLIWASQGWLLVAGAIVIVLIVALVIYTNINGMEQLPEWVQTIAIFSKELLSELPSTLAGASKSLRDAWNPARSQIERFVSEDLNRRVVASPVLRNQLLALVPEEQLAKVLFIIDAPYDGNDVPSDIPASLSSWSSVWRYLQFEDVQLSTETYAWMRSKLINELDQNEAALYTFLRRFNRSATHKLDVERRLEAAQVRLKIDQPGLWNEFDRLSAEREFRSAIALPVALSLGICALLLVPHSVTVVVPQYWLGGIPFHLADSIRVDWLIAAIVALLTLNIFINASSKKQAEASNILSASLQQAVIEPKDYSAVSVDSFNLARRTWFGLFLGIDI
jgi:hypothetical protein